MFCGRKKKQKTKQNKKNICKTYTLPPHRWLRKKPNITEAAEMCVIGDMSDVMNRLRQL